MMDKHEFEQAVERYSSAVYRCAFTYCGSRSDAWDIVQETFIRLLYKSPEFKDESHKKAWLLRVAVNLSKNTVRSFWRRNRSELDESQGAWCSELESCEIWTMVNSLPAKYRIVTELYYREGYNITEISRIVGASISTVSGRLKRARELLEKMYNEEE